MKVKATPAEGIRVKKPDGLVLKAEGETVERSAFWVRRENDGDVLLSEARLNPPTPLNPPLSGGRETGEGLVGNVQETKPKK